MTHEDHYYAGIDHFAEGRFDEAIAEYLRALEINPNFTDALHGLAQAYYARGDYNQCIASARRILEQDPEDVLAYTSISRAYQKKGMIPEAEEASAKARVLGWKRQLQQQKGPGNDS